MNVHVVDIVVMSPPYNMRDSMVTRTGLLWSRSFLNEGYDGGYSDNFSY